MLDRLIHALVESSNGAADDLLLEALRLGNEREQTVALDALIRRKTDHGLSEVILRYDALPDSLKLTVLQQIRTFHHALRECGRSKEAGKRLAAMRLIALGRQGKLAFVLSENLHDVDEAISKAACEAMVALARRFASEARNLQRGWATPAQRREGIVPSPPPAVVATYLELIEQRPEVEQAVARAIDIHRGRHGQDLLRAALLLCDWAGSRTLGILHTAKHGGQSPMVRRLQQPPASEHVEAFLLGASHGGLRSHFGIVFSHIEEAPVLDALLRKTHWLKDHQLRLCMQQVTRGPWWSEADLTRDIQRRDAEDAARIGEWLAGSGVHDVLQDERLLQLLAHACDDVGARLRLLRIVCQRPRGASVQLLRVMLEDPDERLARMAAREIVRRRPPEYENILLQLMTTAPDTVKRIIGRSIGQVGFEHFWNRFGRLDKATRRQAGKAMLKILPDALRRLGRRLASGPVEQRLKAMQIVQELELAEPMREMLMQLARDPNPKLRSKAVHVLGDLPTLPSEVLLEHVLNDTDARVRANAIEILEAKQRPEYLPVLTQRARSASNRERANAIKALHRMRVGLATSQLYAMLQDQRPEHRISALWALRQIGWWQMLQVVGRMAKEDGNQRVRRYAMGVLRNVVETMQATGTSGVRPAPQASGVGTPAPAVAAGKGEAK